LQDDGRGGLGAIIRAVAVMSVRAAGQAIFERGSHEGPKQRMRLERPGAELRVKLAA
jgi:hypothetical protein